MENLPPTGKSGSYDLPIRSTKPSVTEISPNSDSMDPKGQHDEAPEKLTQADPSPEAECKPESKFNAPVSKIEDVVASTIGQSMTGVSKKKRKSKKPKSMRGKDKPTGFEEYNADGPLTPQVYEEERRLYDPSRPFLDRLDSALIRFQYRRRIESERRNMFHKYLQYGGITVGPNFGTGVTPQELKEMGEEEAMRARSQTAIAQERQGIEINFTKVLKGYLGSYFVRFFNPENEGTIKLATSTIGNFYTYLLFHEVCPEYEEDILEARKICATAAEELGKNIQLVSQAPGKFNEACSTLCGGIFFVPAESESSYADGAWMSLEDARQIATAGTTAHKQVYRFQDLADQDPLVIPKASAQKVQDIHGFEILAITSPDAEVRNFYREYALPNLKPVGKMRARSFRDPAKPEPDMSPAERLDWDQGKAPEYEFEFLLEEDLLALCYPGLKVLADVWQVNGMYYFDEIFSTYPSFYTVLANDMMLEWKRPKEITPEEVMATGHEKEQNDSDVEV